MYVSENAVFSGVTQMNIFKMMMNQWVEIQVFHKHLPFGCVWKWSIPVYPQNSPCKQENDHEPFDFEVYLILEQSYPLVMTNIAIE